jgi:CheY-like chemotaxis protein
MNELIYRRIYLVDDDEDDAFMIHRAFKKIAPSTQFTHLGDGYAFLERVKRGDLECEHALLFLDINMPKLTGFDVLKKLQGEPVLEQLDIIVLSTSEQDADREMALTLGAIHFQPKPHSYQELLSFAESVLESF